MPIVTVTKEAAHYMLAACRNTRTLVAAHPVKRDYFPKYEASQAWALVAPLYNGIEQALKMLLLTPSDPRFTLKKPKDGDLHRWIPTSRTSRTDRTGTT